ncbi:hypothetical protein D3C71_1707570 [compost metagenome]
MPGDQLYFPAPQGAEGCGARADSRSVAERIWAGEPAGLQDRLQNDQPDVRRRLLRRSVNASCEPLPA